MPEDIQRRDIYKTLALIGDKTGPIVGILPLTEHLSEKKLAKVSGNKKVHMIPQKICRKPLDTSMVLIILSVSGKPKGSLSISIPSHWMQIKSLFLPVKSAVLYASIQKNSQLLYKLNLLKFVKFK